jgi:DeoR family transcriptional regulator, fructose operon transcriptional repressor
MDIHTRRSIIARRLAEEHTVAVGDLAEEMGVSGMTVRRDLAELERIGYARRIYGGAVREAQRSFEPSVVTRYAENAGEKRRIAEAAVALLRPGDSIAIDVGSTTMYFAECLRDSPDLRLVVVTPSLSIGGELSENASYTVVVTGGVVRRGELSLTGDLALSAFRHFHVDKLFLSVAGISRDTGLTEFNMEDAAVKREMIASARQVIVLADSEKFGRTALCGVGGLDDMDILITGEEPPREIRDALDGSGTELIVAQSGV